MRKTHIKTDFINFIIEKYSTSDDDDNDEKKPKKKDDDEDEDDDEDNTSKKSTDDDDEIIEKLLTEYKNVKKLYPNNNRYFTQKIFVY